MGHERKGKIPDKSTPVKNIILIDIIARGLLMGEKLRIVAYIIRHSWGYVGKEEGRRQDWTEPLSMSDIAKDIEMALSHCTDAIYEMIERNILLYIQIGRKRKYQFNEHFEKWKVTRKVTLTPEVTSDYPRGKDGLPQRSPDSLLIKDKFKDKFKDKENEKNGVSEIRKRWAWVCGSLFKNCGIRVHFNKRMPTLEREVMEEALQNWTVEDILQSLDNLYNLMMHRTQYPYMPHICSLYEFMRPPASLQNGKKSSWLEVFLDVNVAKERFSEKGWRGKEGKEEVPWGPSVDSIRKKYEKEKKHIEGEK